MKKVISYGFPQTEHVLNHDFINDDSFAIGVL